MDIDGVLNSMPYHKNKKDDQELNPDNLKHLAVIQHKTHAKIILCSTWKDLNHPDEPEVYKIYLKLINTLKKYGLTITDSTPETKKGRPCDIHKYLNQHPADKFVILDDDYHDKDYKTYGLDKNLIQTYYFCCKESQGGLQVHHAKKAIKLLT